MAQELDEQDSEIFEHPLVRGCTGTVAGFFINIILFTLAILLFRLFFDIEPAEFWRLYIAEPIYRLIAQLFIQSAGNILITLTLVAFIMLIISSVLSLPTMIGLKQSVKYAGQITPEAVSQVDARKRLRTMFGDDKEKMALYQHQLREDPADAALRRAQRTSCSGCLFGVFWSYALMPVRVLIGLGFYDALLRLFSGEGSTADLLESAGELAPQMAPYLPLPETALSILNIPLVLLLLVLVLLYWLAGNFTVSGWTYPVGLDRWTWLILLLTMIFAGFFLTPVLLVVVIMSQLIYLVLRILNRFFLRSIYLRVRGARIRRRNMTAVNSP